MATHGKGDNGQIAALVMATRAKGNVGQVYGTHGECEDGLIAGKCNDGQITGACGKGYIEGSSCGAKGALLHRTKPLPSPLPTTNSTFSSLPVATSKAAT